MGWEPIKRFSSLHGDGVGELTNEGVTSALAGADPAAVERAGRAFLDASDLLGRPGHGETGVRGTLRRVAAELAEAWTGEAAVSAQHALRKLYATAGSLGEAMHSTGNPLLTYGERLRHYRDTVPGDPSLPAPERDEAAREHLRAFTAEIARLNDALPDGVSCDLPLLVPGDADPRPATPIGTRSEGSQDIGDGGTAGGPTVTAEGLVVTASLAEVAPGTTDPAPGPQPDGDGEVSAVIGGPGFDTRTELADAHPMQPNVQPQSQPTAPPVLSTSYADRVTAMHATPFTLLSPAGVIGTGTGTGTGSGSESESGSGSGSANAPRAGSGEGVVAPALIGTAREGHEETRPFMPMMPMMGGGGGADGGGDERDRTFYDPESEAWRFVTGSGPDRIG